MRDFEMDNEEILPRIEKAKTFLTNQGWHAEESAFNRCGVDKYCIVATKREKRLQAEDEILFKAYKKIRNKILNQHIEICYLCGKDIGAEDTSRDHIPPAHFHPSIYKKRYDNLFTIAAHASCNNAYQKDEDYFSHALGFLASETDVGKALWDDIRSRLSEKMDYGFLMKKVYDESFNRPELIYLPNDQHAHKFDGERVWRIVWKITRGLYFKETGTYLPEDSPKNCVSIGYINKELPEEYKLIEGERLGRHKEIFDYKYSEITMEKQFNVWAMLFWSSLVVVITFLTPSE